MIALLIFSLIATFIVWWAGRRDAALDPKITTSVLLLLAVMPVLVGVLPKFGFLPRTDRAVGDLWWKVVPAALWLAGFLIAFARLLLGARGLSEWRRRSTEEGKIEGVEIRVLPGLHGPVAAGVFRKMVFVPDDWNEWPGGRREIVLEHELAHHRRKDPLRRWIAHFAVAVNWFNPLVRWMVRRLLIQCEFACDEQVLKAGISRESYANALCDFADDRRLQGGMLPMAERSGLESRVRRMMDPPRKGQGDLGSGWLILFAVAMAGLLAILGAEGIEGYTRDEIDLRRTADPFPGR